MDRKEFLKIACGMGLCSCAGASLIAREQVSDSATHQTDEGKEVVGLNRKIDDIQKKYAAIIGILSQRVDEVTLGKIYEDMGRNCAKENEAVNKKYRNNLPGFFEWIKKNGWSNVEIDEKNKVYTVSHISSGCGCPAVKDKNMPGVYCQCSLSALKTGYSLMAGKPVDVAIVESVLRGGKRCVFKITILDEKTS